MANPKNYFRPKTLAAALDLSRQYAAPVLAGGALTLGSDAPETVIDVQDIPELRRVETSDSGATFGSAVMLQAILSWPALPAALRRALTRTVPLNLRNNISVGESLRHWRTPMLREWITALLAHDIGIELTADAGTNHAADAGTNHAADAGDSVWNNIIGLFATARLHQAFITAVNIPALAPGEALGAAYVARTPADLPIVNAAAFLNLDATARRVESAFVFVGGASAEPIMQVGLPSLSGNPLDAANIASAVKAVAPQVNPVSDYLGSAEYRREMARVTVQRALTECMETLT